MDAQEAKDILERLLEGIDPMTGEMLPNEHVCAQPDVMRALYFAICRIREISDAAAMSNNMSALPDNTIFKKNGQLNAGRPWTKEDDASLVKLHREKASVREICEQMQRRKRGVHNRMVYLGLISEERLQAQNEQRLMSGQENAGKYWTADEDHRLIELFGQGWTNTEIAAELRRSEPSIFYRLRRWGLIDDTPISPWTELNTAELRAMISEGKLSLKEIADRFGRTVPAIQARLFYMGVLKELPFSLFAPSPSQVTPQDETPEPDAP